MPRDPEANDFPFLTRKMLSFEAGAAIGLRIDAISETGTALLIRGATKDGTFAYRHVTGSGPSLSNETFRITDIPIWLTVLPESQGTSPGAMYARISLVIEGDILHQLCAGYIYDTVGISWPQTNLAEPLPPLGQITSRATVQPAAGAEFAVTIPDFCFFLVHSVTFRLVTDATAANRRVHLLFKAGNNRKVETFNNTDHAASLTRDYSAAHYGVLNDEVDDTKILIPLPTPVWLAPGDSVNSVTTNIQAGDQFSTILVHGQQYLASVTS